MQPLAPADPGATFGGMSTRQQQADNLVDFFDGLDLQGVKVKDRKRLRDGIRRLGDDAEQQQRQEPITASGAVARLAAGFAGSDPAAVRAQRQRERQGASG